MHERRFSNWVVWGERKALVNSASPGVYVIARSERNIAGSPFAWSDWIIYIGMTNSLAGLKGRLKQFDDTISGRRLSHGGADRVRLKHQHYERLAPSLFVSVASFKCNPASAQPNDLRKLGDVAKFEFVCLAEFAEHFKRLPQFNDKTESPKFSKLERK